MNGTNETFSVLVYLKTSPQVVWDRMMKRGRAEESEVPLEYLQQVLIMTIYILRVPYIQ